MNVFISWSGPVSRAIAQALRDWLPTVIQAVKPWMSEIDIDKGARWEGEILTQLEEASLGIICLTPDNLGEPWVLFEAGALVKHLKQSRVCTYLYRLKESDVARPLAMFQHTRAERADTKRLLDSINRALGDAKLQDTQLEKAFERGWPELEAAVERVPEALSTAPGPSRSEREILEEILSLVREMANPPALEAPSLGSLLSGRREVYPGATSHGSEPRRYRPGLKLPGSPSDVPLESVICEAVERYYSGASEGGGPPGTLPPGR